MKLMLAFMTFYTIELQIGSRQQQKSWVEIAIFTLIATVLPQKAMSVLLAIFVITHMTAISVEAGAIATIFFLFLFLTYFVFKPRQSILIIVMSLAGMMNMNAAVVIPMGLLYEPICIIPAAAGSFVYGMIITLRQNSSVLETASSRLTSMEKASYFIKAVFENERLLLLVVVLVITVIVVYVIRRLPYSYAWAIAIAAGAASYVLIVMVGNVAFAVTVNLFYLSISVVIGVLAAGIINMFKFLLDGTHTEFLEYEDEDYVYYVKAIPKYSLTRTDKKIKTITKSGENPDEDLFSQDSRSLDDYFRE